MDDKVRVTFEFAGNLGEETERVTQGIKGLRDESATTFTRLLTGSDATATALRRLGQAAGAAFSIHQLTKFAAQVRDVRAEMQMTQSSFEVLLGGKGKAAAMVTELTQYATNSPIGLMDASDAAQKLLGFGVAAENVMPTIKQLGDISMGSKERFSALALAFAQMTATGKLTGQDLLQMVNAGFNPLLTMSERTGKSLEQLRKEMSNGAISSKMVADAFRVVTEEGGKFYGMTEKQMEGLKGLQAQLEGSLSTMFNELGKSSEGFMVSAYKSAITLAENYDKVGKTLAVLLATFGAYKTALILVTALEKGYTVAQLAHYRALLLSEKAQKLLNATMLKNPYVLIATVMVAAVAALVAFGSASAGAKEKVEEFHGAVEGAKSAIESCDTGIMTAALAELEKQAASLNTTLAKLNATPWWKRSSEEYNLITMSLVEARKEIKTLKAALKKQSRVDEAAAAVHNKEYWETIKKNAQSALDVMDISLKGTAEWNKQLALVADAEKKIQAYTGKDKSEKNANKDKATSAALLKEAQEMRAKIAQKEKEEELKRRQENINLKREGLEKDLAQIALDYDIRRNEISKFSDEMVKLLQEVERKEWEAAHPRWKEQGLTFISPTTALPPELQALVDNAYADAGDTSNKAKEDRHKALLREFENLAAKRLRIEEEYDRKIKELEDGRAERNAEATDASIAEARRLRGIALSELDAEALKTTDFYQKLFSSLSDKGYATLLRFSEQVNKVLDDATHYKDDGGRDMVSISIPTMGDDGKLVRKNVNITIEEFIRLKTKSTEITDVLRKQNPFKGIAEGFKDVQKALKEGGEKKVENLGNAMAKLDNSVKNSKAVLGDWGNALGDIFGEGVGQAISEIAELAGGVADMAVGIGKFAAGDVVGGITSALQGVASIVKTISAWEERRIDQQRKIFLAQIDINRLMREQEYSLIDTVTQVKAFRENTEALAWLLQHGFIAEGKADAWTVVKNQYDKKNQDILAAIKENEDIKVALSNAKWKTEEWFGSCLEIYRSESGNLAAIRNMSDEDAKKYLDDLDAQGALTKGAKELYDAWKESGANIEGLRDDLSELYDTMEQFATGTNFDSFLDGATEALAGMRENITGLADFTEDALTKAIISSFKYRILADALQPVYDELAAKFIDDPDGITKEWADGWKEKVNGVLTDGGAILNGIFDSLGIDGAAGVTGSKKGIASMSQDSADELNGKFTTMLMYQDKMNGNLTSIHGLTVTGITHLAAISANTAHLATIKDELNAMRRDGITIKK